MTGLGGPPQGGGPAPHMVSNHGYPPQPPSYAQYGHLQQVPQPHQAYIPVSGGHVAPMMPQNGNHHVMPDPNKKLQDIDTLRQIITQWNANRLDLFALSFPNEDLEFNGVMRFYYQSQDADSAADGQKVATKCIRVSSTATTKVIIETLIEKFRPDMKMLEVPEYALYEIHESGERRLNPEEKPLLVQLNWHKDDREGRFLLRRIDEMSKIPEPTQEDSSFKRKLSKREKKQLKKQEKLNKLKEKEGRDQAGSQEGVAEKLYTELPDTSFTRSISNPEAVMRRRRQQKLEKKLQQFRSKDGGPDTGGTLKIYGESLCKDVPYKTLLLSVIDSAQYVVEEMLEKYGRNRTEAVNYCLVQCAVDRTGNAREYFLDDEDCPLAILMNTPPNNGNSTFHVRIRPPADAFPRKKKKKPVGFPMMTSENNLQAAEMNRLPCLFETLPDGSELTNGLPQRFIIPPNVTEIGTDANSVSAGGQCLILQPSPGLFPKHCVLANIDGIVTITPNNREAEVFVNNQRIFESTILQHGFLLQLGRGIKSFRFLDPYYAERERMRHFASSVTLPEGIETNSNSNYAHYGGHPHHLQQQQQQQQQQQRGNENILPAVLEFREETEEAFFNSITVSLDTSKVQFKLAPTYTIYMATRFRASTHYRPELIPEERAVRLTAMLNRVSEKLFRTVGMNQHVASKLAFWMANSSELLHFLKSDKHITSFSSEAQDVLADTVHFSFKQLVLCLQNDLKQAMPQMLSNSEDDEIKRVMDVLTAAMNLLRKCRVNAALTIQLFSQLFHFINMWTFNQVIMSGGNNGPNYCTHKWGLRLKKRLNKIEIWAEKQGLELAADCHLARVVQAAHLMSARKNSADDIASLSSTCFKLNSLQLNTLLKKYEPDANESPISSDMIETIVRVAKNTVDEVTNSEGREVRLEEDYVLQLPFLLPEDGYSCDIVRGVPGGLVEFVSPLQQVGLCILTPQPASRGYWTIYMIQLDMTPMMQSPIPRSPSEMSQATLNGEMISSPPPLLSQGQIPHPQQQQQPEIQVIQLTKSNNGMGLSIVAAKGVGKDRLGIYIKAVVEGGAAFHDGRLEAGDQLLKVDGHSLVGITQESAAEIMLKTGNVVELEVAKQGALYHGLATLLSQPSPMNSRSSSTMSQSKSVPALHPGHPSYPTQYGNQQHQGPYQPEQQLVYQNQNNMAFRQNNGPTISQRPTLRSSSQQNLTRHPVSPQKGQFEPNVRFSHPEMAAEEQGFYQNVGPSQPTFFPNQVRETDVFHASPRVSGTPQVSNDLNQGPEKPQRQYAYEPHSSPLHQHQEPRKEVHFENGGRPRKASQSQHINGNTNGAANRVRFQEPIEITGSQHHPPSGHGPNVANNKNLSNQLDQLRINSVEKEFRKRVEEYKRENESASDSEPPSNEIQSKLKQKRLELEEHQRAEQLILQQAEKRRQENSTGSGDTPPPLPSVPPPEGSPTAPSGASRLDMLVGGGMVNKNSNSTSSPVKKVSFVTNGDEQDHQTKNGVLVQNEKLARLERVEKDPNAFITEAESLLNSSSLALEKFDFNKSTGHTPSVIGTQEVYRDPRQKRLQKELEEKATANKRDGAKLSFQEKMKLFAVEAGESTPRDKAKISKAQREILDENNESSA